MIYSLLLLLLSFTPQQAPENTATLSLRIENVKSEEGAIAIAIYTESNDFMSDDDLFKAVRITPKSPVTEKDFVLPPGRYAVAVYHDINSSEKMEKSWLGIPKEPVGLSRNAIKGFSRPTFEDAAFQLEGDRTVAISLRNF